MDTDDMGAAVREVGRVLEQGGRFCFAVVHPINGAGAFEDGAYVMRGSSLAPHPIEDVVDRGGHRIRLAGTHRPLEDYTRAVEAVGLLLEALREPPYDAHPNWSRLPLLLHVRAVEP